MTLENPLPADALTTIAVSTAPAEPEGLVLAAQPEAAAESVAPVEEIDLWVARYSIKNFLSRFVILTTLTLACAAFAYWVRAYGKLNYEALPLLAGIGLGFAWLFLARRIVLDRYGRHYLLTNRNVFVTTGVFTKMRDQVELFRVVDVQMTQSLTGRWLSVGNVLIISKESQTPNIHLIGVDDPQAAMDLVAQYANTEQERRTAKG